MTETPKQSERVEDWQRSIGHFILNFGQLESLIIVFLEKRLEKAEFEVTPGARIIRPSIDRDVVGRSVNGMVR